MQRLLLFGAVIGAVLAAAPRPAVAQALVFEGGLGVGLAVVDDAAAEAEGLPARGGVGVYVDLAPRAYGIAALRAEAGLIFLEPVCFNEEAACPGRDDRFLALSGSLGAGLVLPGFRLGGGLRVAPGLFAGREWLSGWRSPSGCVNCFDDALRLRGGLYAEPALVLSIPADLGLSIAYRVYHPRSDLKGRAAVRFFMQSP